MCFVASLAQGAFFHFIHLFSLCLYVLPNLPQNHYHQNLHWSSLLERSNLSHLISWSVLLVYRAALLIPVISSIRLCWVWEAPNGPWFPAHSKCELKSETYNTSICMYMICKKLIIVPFAQKRVLLHSVYGMSQHKAFGLFWDYNEGSYGHSAQLSRWQQPQ